jgi:hypothetical protein
MDHRKDIERLANELSKALGSIDALTAALVGMLQVVRNDPSLSLAVVENMKAHRLLHKGLPEDGPFSEGFQMTQTYVSEILESNELRRRFS